MTNICITFSTKDLFVSSIISKILAMTVSKILAITVPLLLGIAFLTLAERKVMASMQRRKTPVARRDVALNYIGLKSIGYIMLHYIQCSCPYIWLSDSVSSI